MQTAIIKLPDTGSVESREFLDFEEAEVLDTEVSTLEIVDKNVSNMFLSSRLQNIGTEIRTTEFHPTDNNVLASVIDGKIVIFQRAEAQSRVAAEINAKNSPKFSGGKWSQHHQGHQFIGLFEGSIKSYDIRDTNHCAWTIEDSHGQLVRDLDCNPNKQCHIVTGGDDGSIKIWDCRNTKESLFSRNDHNHWIWNVRFNTFHDQLILSSSSDAKVLLTCASSVSSESDATNSAEGGELKEHLADGLLQTFDQHEDSVYCVEWSASDPWIFASLSYDGRFIVSKVPKQYKYQILL